MEFGLASAWLTLRSQLRGVMVRIRRTLHLMRLKRKYQCTTE